MLRGLFFFFPDIKYFPPISCNSNPIALPLCQEEFVASQKCHLQLKSGCRPGAGWWQRQGVTLLWSNLCEERAGGEAGAEQWRVWVTGQWLKASQQSSITWTWLKDRTRDNSLVMAGLYRHRVPGVKVCSLNNLPVFQCQWFKNVISLNLLSH